MTKELHVTEDEQLVRLKSWWKSNAKAVVIGISFGVLLIIGYNWWQSHQASKAIKASNLFSELLDAVEEKDLDAAESLTLKLKQGFKGIDYADKGSILLAVNQLSAGKIAQAKEGLNWVLTHSKYIENKQLAAVKLARQLYREQAYDEALAVLDIKNKGGFASQINEIIGDIENSKDNFKAAHAAYTLALDQLPESSTYRDILQLKLNNSAL